MLHLYSLSLTSFILLTDNLGNACLTSFFVTGAWDHNKLLQSLKAYQNAVSVQSKGLPYESLFHPLMDVLDYL